MNDLHLDDFRKDAAVTLIRLFNNFPRLHSLYVIEICSEDTLDEFGLPSKRHESCMSAMIWLAEEGLIRYKQILPDEGIEQAVLTAKGIKLLLLPGENKKPFIENIRASIQSRSSQKLEKFMDKLILSINTA